MSSNKKSLLSSQIMIVLWILLAAITGIETMAQFQAGGFSNPKVYFFAVIFIVCAVMYFIRRKKILQERK